MTELAKSSIGADDPGGDQFAKIHRAEIEKIKERRKELKREGDPLAPKHRKTVFETVGLALSGGGVRSAAFALGALQALDHHKILKKIDYLSTVSGGGYMGSSLSATMTASKGEFVYRGEDKRQTGTQPVAAEISDTEAVGHIRNYSNYLIPGGMRDVLTGAAILVRGLVANAALVLPAVLLFAALTIWSNPFRSSLTTPDLFGISLARFIPVNNFGITLALLIFGFALFLYWALQRSLLKPEKLSEFRTKWPSVGAGFLALVAVSFFCELQPFVVSGMFDLAEGDGTWGHVTAAVKWLATITAPIAATAAFFRQQLSALVSTDDASTKLSTKALVPLGKIAIWLAGLALPLLIWVFYLYLCYWGIINDAAPGPKGGEHTPRWLLTLSEWTSYLIFGHVIERPMALLYTAFGLILFAVTWCSKPNANSLHRLYRDRLSKAFLFDPVQRAGTGSVSRDVASIDQNRDFAALDGMRLSEISTVHAPYHLVNAALNVQGSDYANRRGRNADFFLMSPLFVGSQATGYAPTKSVEIASPDFDLATAMAISGAAASSNMGAKSIRPLTPTLAILNIRLGYWLKNPRYTAEEAVSPDGERKPKRRPKWSVRNASLMFLWSEITGRLYENSNEVYLTDGGHIENLGIYELLRRRCRVIVCIDAEADPEMRFSSFMTLQRFARIDLGIRFDMPWEKIQAATLANTGGAPRANGAPAEKNGPHVSVGTIDYGRGEKGYLIYVKSSLTGDENDYIRDYARRHRQFPHETTGDQFFSEEQFEVYRALAFHVVHKVFDGVDGVEAVGSSVLENYAKSTNPAVVAVRTALA